MSSKLGNTGYAEELVLASEGQLYIAKWGEWDDTYPLDIGVLPADHYVRAIDMFIHTAFDGAINTMIVGNEDDPDGYVTATGVGSAPTSATRTRNHNPGALTSLYQTAAKTAKIDMLSLAGATQGKVLVVVWYVIAPTVP